MSGADEAGLRAKLAQVTQDRNAVLFAVADAAQFDDFDAVARRGGLSPRPLYLDEGDVISTGPQLLAAYAEGSVSRILNVLEGRPAAVWWVWQRGDNADLDIYAHLRGLAMIELPRGRFDARQKGKEHAKALFRHCDPNVMAGVIPLLDPAQSSRLFGDARALVVDAPDAGGVQTFARPDDLPPAPRGMLRVRDPEQYQEISNAYTDALRNRAVREFAAQPEDAGQVRDAFKRAETYGMTSKAMIWEFIAFDRQAGARFEDRAEHTDLRAALMARNTNGYGKLNAIKAQLSTPNGGE